MGGDGKSGSFGGGDHSSAHSGTPGPRYNSPARVAAREDGYISADEVRRIDAEDRGGIMGGGGSNTNVTEPAPSAQEQELLDLILQDLRGNLADRERFRQKIGGYEDLLNQDFTSGELTPDETKRLDEIQSRYVDTRTQALDLQGEEARKRAAERLARSGIADSTIANDAYTQLDKSLSQAKDQVTKEGLLLRSGTEADLRQNILAERLKKIGVLSGINNTDLAANAFSSIANARSQESNRLLQAALASAQNSGGNSALDFFGTILAGLATGAGKNLFAPRNGNGNQGLQSSFSDSGNGYYGDGTYGDYNPSPSDYSYA